MKGISRRRFLHVSAMSGGALLFGDLAGRLFEITFERKQCDHKPRVSSTTNLLKDGGVFRIDCRSQQLYIIGNFKL